MVRYQDLEGLSLTCVYLSPGAARGNAKPLPIVDSALPVRFRRNRQKLGWRLKGRRSNQRSHRAKDRTAPAPECRTLLASSSSSRRIATSSKSTSIQKGPRLPARARTRIPPSPRRALRARHGLSPPVRTDRLEDPRTCPPAPGGHLPSDASTRNHPAVAFATSRRAGLVTLPGGPSAVKRFFRLAALLGSRVASCG